MPVLEVCGGCLSTCGNGRLGKVAMAQFSKIDLGLRIPGGEEQMERCTCLVNQAFWYDPQTAEGLHWF